MSAIKPLPDQSREDMIEAAAEILECYRLLHKSGFNIVSEVLRGDEPLLPWEHYPEGDAYDPETHAQYYYHAHPVRERDGEYGHFHTFLRTYGMPAGVVPVPLADFVTPEDENAMVSHLIAIAMDRSGYPVALFTTNRWVTGETWYCADDVIRMLDHFVIDMAFPSLVVNRWISAMLRLFRPEIEALIHQRDEAVAQWHFDRGAVSVHTDRALEVTSHLPISVDAKIAELGMGCQDPTAGRHRPNLLFR